MKLFFAFLILLTLPLSAERSIELFVALCDNKTQGIAPVGAKIGNGDDALTTSTGDARMALAAISNAVKNGTCKPLRNQRPSTYLKPSPSNTKQAESFSLPMPIVEAI